MTIAPLATRQPGRLTADPSRVITELFVPGHYLPSDDDARASGVVDHILALDDDQVTATLHDLVQRFGTRHRNLDETFRHHASRIGNRLPVGAVLSEARWSLLGATFTHEYAVEAAALCNPSAVVALDQSGSPSGSLRFVMSVRQIGEGHRSSIGFRTGTLGHDGAVTTDPTPAVTTAATIRRGDLEAEAFRGLADGLDEDAGASRWVLDRLGERFTVSELDVWLALLNEQHDTRQNVGGTVRRLRQLVDRTYTADFDPTSELGERVLYPYAAVEANGMEDARFVRFVDDDGSITYYATYTAFDGSAIVQQLLATRDFLTFTSSPLLGFAAANKGLALFPRRINGRFAALSRHDGGRNAIAYSEDIRQWPSAIPIACPVAPWEAVQVGNCGPPVETDAGWLVLTHGVGPMRTYSIGAWLLDRDDPSKLLGRLEQPLLAPLPDERDGYVPNVVYSCGAVLHRGTLLIPYGIGDASIGFATVELTALLAAMDTVDP